MGSDPKPYPFLDRTADELVNGGNDIVFYCACGHHKKLGRWEFEQIKLPLHRICRAAKCTACGTVGAISQITVLPRRTGGFGYGA